MHLGAATILTWLLVGSAVGEQCGSGPICRLSVLDTRTAHGGWDLLEGALSGRYAIVKIQTLVIGSDSVAALLTNVSIIADVLVFRAFHETTLALPAELTLQELVLHQAMALQGFTAETNVYLRRLEIDTCAMSATPSSLRNLLHLKDLSIARCPFEKFDMDLLANLSQLETVLLVGNQIVSIDPPQEAILSSIRWLDLSQNQLKRLDMSALVSLVQLRTLSTANNQLTAISYGGDGVEVIFPHLSMLDLSNNKLPSVAFDQLSAPSLEHLQLSFNVLSAVPGPLLKFTKLVTLSLNHNAVETLSFALLEGLCELTNLELSHNRLHTLDTSTAVQLPRLNLLKLSDNRLQNVDLEKLTLPRLGCLDLSYNLLTIVPAVFERGRRVLQMVTVIGNPLTCATLETYRAYVQQDVLVPKWILSDAELCSTGSMFVLNKKRRSCCVP